MKTIKTIPFRWSLAALLFLALQPHAWAHAFLDHSNPKVGGTITTSPSVIKIWFTQNLEPAFSTIKVRDAQGKEVDKQDVHLDDKDPSLLMVSVPPLPDGTYTVTWHVTSVDTHRTQGRFEFTIQSK